MTQVPLFNSVTLVCQDNSWLLPYIKRLNRQLNEYGVSSCIVNNYADVKQGDAAFFLGCTTVCPKKILTRNLHNFVVHESDLPKGRGFAPISWAILQNHSKLVFSLIEALEQVDTGKIYSQYSTPLRGNELCDEIRELQGATTINICFQFIVNGSLDNGRYQTGEPTYNRRRIPSDSELDVNRSLAEQFNLLRVVDNEKYPAFFNFRGRRYKLKIEDMGATDD